METLAYSRFEQSSLINELREGMELAKQLKAQMGPQYSVQSQEKLLQQIVSSYDKALFILGMGGPSGLPHQSLPAMLLSPVSAMASPTSDGLHVELSKSYKEGKQTPKKRKAASTWTQQVKVSSGAESEGPKADGFSWRKYGQKDILGTKNPRSYYRCTYRNIHDCWATKQVQRSDEDPTIFHITYKGKHTCTQERHSKSAPVSPGKQEAKQENHLNIEHQKDAAVDLSFQNAPITDSFPFSWTDFSYLNGESTSFLPSTISNTDNFYGNVSPSLISPSTPGSNYFSMSPCTTDNFASLHNPEQQLDHEFSEMLSVTLSPADSPTIELDFSPDAWSFSQNFPVNNL
ncbi:hypothetical protein V2J09_004861 [Rumex salicifolius]